MNAPPGPSAGERPSPAAAAPRQQPQLARGVVRHCRLRPVRHAFAYPTFFLLLPLRAMRADGPGALARNRRAAVSFWDRDHGDGGTDALAWVEALLAREGITDADGEIWLQCHPRVLGYVFKPVSFWYCERADASLRAVVAEVNNTFGERHCYLLDAPAWGRTAEAAKVFHVSPFCETRGRYSFRFLLAAGRKRVVARVDYDDGAGPLLETSVSGALEPATRRALLAAVCAHPLLTFAIVARIHWQALKLWARGVPFHAKPDSPGAFLTR